MSRDILPFTMLPKISCHHFKTDRLEKESPLSLRRVICDQPHQNDDAFGRDAVDGCADVTLAEHKHYISSEPGWFGWIGAKIRVGDDK